MMEELAFASLGTFVRDRMTLIGSIRIRRLMMDPEIWVCEIQTVPLAVNKFAIPPEGPRTLAYSHADPDLFRAVWECVTQMSRALLEIPDSKRRPYQE